jgi:putative ABC transport system permease protein
VHEIRIPRLRQHPHQGLMTAVQLVLLLFSLLLLVLTAVVLATMLSAILARQARELGVMKAIGASTGQLVVLYTGFVGVIGAGALLVAIPLAYAGARAMTSQVATMMNLAAFDQRIPRWVFLVLAVLGTLVPLVFAMVPILRAARVTVRQSLSHHGAGADFVRPSLSRLPISLRNALRHPVRLAFSMAMLGMAGTLVLSAANTQHGLTLVSSKLEVARRFDVELRLHEPVPAARVASLAAVPGVLRLESWPAVESAFVQPGQRFDVMHTYPDGGHGSAMLTAPPPGSTALNLPVRRGRWLDLTAGTNTGAGEAGSNAGEASVAGEVVLGHGHPAARRAALGELVTLSVEGKHSTWKLVGVVEELGGSSAFVNEAAYRRATGDAGVRLLRLTTTARSSPERDAIIANLERTLVARGIAVQYAMPALLLRSIIDDHVAMVVRAVLAMAGLLALVGFFGLGSMTAIGVAERTREIGVMKTLGASQLRILWIILAESLAVAAVSSALAALLSLPMTALINAHVAIGFLAPPSFMISPLAYLAWPAAALIGSALACLLPARRAARLSIRQTFAEV